MSLLGDGSLRAILAAMAALPASRRLLAPVLLCLGLIACSLDPQPEPPLESTPGKNEGGSAAYDAGAGKGGSAGSVSHGGSAGSGGEVGMGGFSGVSGSAGAAGAAGGGETDGGDPVTDAAGEGGWTDADPDSQNPDAADGDPDAEVDGDTDAGADSPIEAESGDDSGDDASPLDAETPD